MESQQFTLDQIADAYGNCRMAAGITCDFDTPQPFNDSVLEYEYKHHGLLYRVRDYLPGGTGKPFIPHYMQLNYKVLDSKGGVLTTGTMGPGFKFDSDAGTFAVEIHPGFWLSISSPEAMAVAYPPPRDWSPEI